MRRLIKKYVPTVFCVAISILLLSAMLYLVAICYTPFADFLNGTLGTAIRFLLAGLTGWLPFSLFELLLICILPLAVLFVIYLIRVKRDNRDRVRSIFSLLSVISLILSSYVFTLGVGYRTSPLSEKIGIEDVGNIEKEELFYVTEILISETNALAEGLTLQNGETVMPYKLSELCELLSDAFAELNGEYGVCDGFGGGVKPVLFSTVMSDAGITGIYSFFTGEANVNVEYPHYTLPFTAAHEMAHQRGVARENEANFVAFLVCIGSSDEYIRYSGYLGMLEYFLSAAYATDREEYAELYSKISEVAISDMRAAAAVSRAHADSLIGKINDRLNDGYLKFNGTDGVVSYGYAVRLTVGYYRKNA